MQCMLPSMPYYDAWVLQIPGCQAAMSKKNGNWETKRAFQEKGKQIEKPETKIDNHKQPVHYAQWYQQFEKLDSMKNIEMQDWIWLTRKSSAKWQKREPSPSHRWHWHQLAACARRTVGKSTLWSEFHFQPYPHHVQCLHRGWLTCTATDAAVKHVSNLRLLVPSTSAGHLILKPQLTKTWSRDIWHIYNIYDVQSIQYISSIRIASIAVEFARLALATQLQEGPLTVNSKLRRSEVAG